MTEVTDPKLVEVVARQMQAVAEVNGGGLPGIIIGDGDCQWRKYEPLARAAISAMFDALKEPSEGMKLAALDASEDYFVGDAVTAEGFKKGLIAMFSQARKEALENARP